MPSEFAHLPVPERKTKLSIVPLDSKRLPVLRERIEPSDPPLASVARHDNDPFRAEIACVTDRLNIERKARLHHERWPEHMPHVAEPLQVDLAVLVHLDDPGNTPFDGVKCCREPPRDRNTKPTSRNAHLQHRPSRSPRHPPPSSGPRWSCVLRLTLPP